MKLVEEIGQKTRLSDNEEENNNYSSDFEEKQKKLLIGKFDH